MFSNYLKIFFRRFFRHPLYGIISLVSLTIGMTATVLAFLFIRYELSYDRFHSNAKEIYRVAMKSVSKDREETASTITAAVGPSLYEDFPEVMDFVRIRSPIAGYLSRGEKSISDPSICYVDSSFFKVFSFRLLKGNPRTALSQPFSIVLGEQTARKLFGEQDPMGQMVILNNKDAYEVTGLVADPPRNSQIQFSSLISFSTLYKDSRMNMGWNGGWQYLTYIRLSPGASVEGLKVKMPDFMYEKINKKYEQFGERLEPVFEPLTGVYLHSRAQGPGPSGSMGTLLIFTTVSLFILILASINFTNLSTSMASVRSAEIGIRKIYGAERKNLIGQYLGETVLMAFLALFLALVLLEFFLPQFNNIIGKDLRLYGPGNRWLILALPLIVLVVGIVSGSYPAFYLSSFKPLQVIHDVIAGRSHKLRFRNSLVFIQYFIAVVLILTTGVLFKQLRFLLSRDPGFKREQILVVPLIGDKVKENYSLLEEKLKNIPGVVSIASSSDYPGRGLTRNGYLPEGMEKPVMIHVIDVDYDFLNTYGLKIVQGRNFSKKFKSDQSAYLVNQSFVREMNWKDPVGKKVLRGKAHEVIGVVQDFNFAPLNQKIEPLIFTMQPYIGFNYLTISYFPGEIPGLLTDIKKVWNDLFPGVTMNYSFLEDDLREVYRREADSGKIFLYATLLALFLAAIGLFGLASFTTVQRTREVGIRKVMGATGFDIFSRLTRAFTLWVLAANILAWPVAWLIIKNLLENYAYRISMPYLLFILTTFTTLIIAWVAVGYQSLVAANTDPAKTLKYE